MGFRQVIHRLLTGSAPAESQSDALVRLARMQRALGDDLEQLRADHEALKVSHRQFMGRVSAWKKWDKLTEQSEEAAAAAHAPAEPSSWTDPRLTKAQARARLMAAGKLVPSTAPADLKPPTN